MFNQMMAVIHREFLYLWRDRGLRWILLVVSVLGILLFAAIYSAQVLKEIPTAIVDLDRSGPSRELVEHLGQAENLEVTAYPGNFSELEEMIKQGDIVVGVVIPEDYGRQTALGRQARVLMVIDGTNMIYATNATNAVLTVTRTAGAQIGIKQLLAQGVHLNQAQEAYQAIDFREEAWFNPTYNYAYFLVLGLALNMWQQCCTLTACTNVIGEAGRRSWYQIKASGVSKGLFFFSKSLVHIFIFMGLVLPVYFLAFVVFKLPLYCPFGLFLLFTFVFVLALHGVGTLMSSVARNAVDAARFGMLVALPSFILSGFTWPLEAMPSYLQQAVKILPQTWFFQGINYFTFKNPGWDFAVPYFLALLVIAAVCYGAAAVFTSRS